MAQIVVNTRFDAVFQDLLLFISPGFFHFMTRRSEILVSEVDFRVST